MSKYTLVFVGIIFVIWVATLEAKEKSCKMIMADFTKRQLKGLQHCSRTLKYKTPKEKREKASCVLKCLLAHEGLLMEDGHLTWDHVNKVFEKEFPEAMIPNANATFGPCMGHASKFDPDDEYCKTYDPFIKCLMGGISTMCKGL